MPFAPLDLSQPLRNRRTNFIESSFAGVERPERRADHVGLVGVLAALHSLPDVRFDLGVT